jgi:TetR/AcrR family transcriptional regulator, regulator of cefoperazone and chloramphenicol sensitivity
VNKNDDTKAKLIESAGEVFAQHGFRSATIREICRRAGTNVSAVNYHFRDKKGLYASVLESLHQSAVRKYPPDLGLKEGATAEEKLRAFIHSFLLRILDEGFPAWHGKLMAQEIADPTGAIDQLVRNSIRPLFEHLAGIVRVLLQKGDPRDEKNSHVTFLCAISIVGQCLHHFTGRRIIAALRPASFDPTDIERIADHITRFSLGGIREIGTGGLRCK